MSNSLTNVIAKLQRLATDAKEYADRKVAEDSVSFEMLGSANAGYLKSYRFTKGTGLSATTMDIDIPKDFLVKDGKLLTVVAGTGANVGKWMVTHEDGVAVQTEYEAPSGVTSAGQWVDLEINTKGNPEAETPTHICINVTTLLNVLTQGNGININGNTISVKLNATASGLEADVNGLKVKLGTNTNGLSLTANGLELALATAATNGAGGSAGAISGADLEKVHTALQDADFADISNATIDGWFADESSSSSD